MSRRYTDTRTDAEKKLDNKVLRIFNGIAHDLPANVHEDDLLDYLCSSGEFGSYERWEEIEDDVIASIRRRLCPDKKGDISCR